MNEHYRKNRVLTIQRQLVQLSVSYVLFHNTSRDTENIKRDQYRKTVFKNIKLLTARFSKSSVAGSTDALTLSPGDTGIPLLSNKVAYNYQNIY